MANLLSIGSTGLTVAKKSLETTGHNLANVNTEGYSRQRTVIQTNSPIGTGGLIQGTGAKVKRIERVHDQFIEKRLKSNISEHNYFSNRSEQLMQVENIFNEIDNDGLNKVLNRFYNSFRELANQPENETMRSVVRDNAGLVAKDFKRIRETLDAISRNVDSQLKGEVHDINSILKRVANLNKKIASLEGAGDETGDLRDQRDLAVRELSKSFKVHTYLDSNGGYNVSAVNVGTLVSGANFSELATRGTAKAMSKNGMDGTTEIFFKARASEPITHKFKQGTLRALTQVRNEDIKLLQEKVDEIAFEFANTVNAVHRRGYAQRSISTDGQGNAAAFDSQGPTTGINFFEISQTKSGAALTLDLSDSVKENLSNIATGLNANSPGDNRVALAISKLQHERIMVEGTATIEEVFLQTIGNIGINTGKARLDSEQSEGILAQTTALRERMSGVSIDEETANMVRFQHAYDASAKVMQTANDMFDTVLRIKR